jgi:transcriptional regulator with XRE-family HTH domain
MRIAYVKPCDVHYALYYLAVSVLTYSQRREIIALNGLPQRLKKLRVALHKTQEQVAKELNITIGTLSGYERGYRKPDIDMLRKLAAFYHTTADYLLGLSTVPHPLKDLKFDYSALFEHYNRTQAYVIVCNLRHQYNLSDETYMKLIDNIELYYKDEK